MLEAPTCPEYIVESVDESNGKPCVLIRAGAVFYLLTNIEVREDEIEYDLAVGRAVGDAIDWLDDSDVESSENHGMIADLIIADVIQSTSSQ